MPLTYRIVSEERLVLTEGSGVLTDADVLAHKERLLSDPAFQPGMRELSDIRAIERIAVTPEGVRAMVDYDRRAGVAAHRLALVVSQEVAFGMARMYQLVGAREDQSVGVFRSIDEAMQWLNDA
jgi:hypothetical protein